MMLRSSLQHDAEEYFRASSTDSGRQVVQIIHNNAEDCSMDKYEAALFATVLEDTITQLKIIDSCNTEMRITRTLDDMGHLLNIKFGVENDTDATANELEGVNDSNINSSKFKLIKLQRDRDHFALLMKRTYEELSLHNAFCELRRAVLDQVAELDRISLDVQDELQNRIKRRELARQLRQQRVLNQSQTADTETAIAALKTQLEDVALNADIRLRYVSRWQHARTECHSAILSNVEGGPSRRIGNYITSTDNEQRVHFELDSLIAVDIEETLAKIEGWMEKYEKDMEKIDLDVQYKKNDYQNELDRRIHLEETMEEHDTFMEMWKRFKEEREKERQYRERMHRSALAVQSWWRGLLVRKQLGPYRPPKKPKGKKK